MLAQLMSVLMNVLTNKLVITCAIIVFLYINFVWFVARYHKKPPATKRRVVVRAPEPEAAPADAGNADGGGDDGE